MKNYKISIITDEKNNIYDIYNYVANYDSITKGKNLLNKLKKTCQSLSTFPYRSLFPPELERIGVFEYKEIHYKPYQIIYQIIESSVYIHCVFRCSKKLRRITCKKITKIIFIYKALHQFLLII